MPGQKVSFLIAGVQKGGTTALHDYLVEHPDLALPAIKEAHFFDDESRVDWLNPDYDVYHAHFAGQDGRVWGEATPIYLYWPQSLVRIRTYNPEMRLILIFRDPAERAWSHWKMEYARGAETAPFAWAIREGRARVADDPSAPGYHRVYSYVERGFYGAQVEHLLSLFPHQQVLCLRSSDLRREPARILHQVCDFLHVRPFGHIAPKESHVAKDIKYISEFTNEDRAYLAEIFSTDLKIFNNLTRLDFE